MALYVMGYTAGRVWIEALRTDHANHILGLRLNIWTSVIVFALALAVVRAARRLPCRTRDHAVHRRPCRGRADEPRHEPTTTTVGGNPTARTTERRTPSMSDRTSELIDDLPELPNAEIHHEHRDVSGGWLRPTVFGMMDGLVSNFALIAGVAGASATTLAGVAGRARRAGRRCVLDGDRRVHLGAEPERVDARRTRRRAHELQAQRRGRAGRAGPDVRRRAASTPRPRRRWPSSCPATPSRRCSIHAQEELGVDPTQLPSPWTAALSSLASFSVGALLPLLPYLFGAHDASSSRPSSPVIALFTAGALSSRFTSRVVAIRGFAPARPRRSRRCGHVRDRHAVPRLCGLAPPTGVVATPCPRAARGLLTGRTLPLSVTQSSRSPSCVVGPNSCSHTAARSSAVGCSSWSSERRSQVACPIG